MDAVQYLTNLSEQIEHPKELENLVAVVDGFLGETFSKDDKIFINLHIRGKTIDRPISILDGACIFPIEGSEVKIGIYRSSDKYELRVIGYPDEFLEYGPFGKPKSDEEYLKTQKTFYSYLAQN